MTKYLIQEKTLADIADKVRATTGATETLTPTEMQGELNTFNSDMNGAISIQDSLISQIIAALEWKIIPNKVVTSTEEVEEGSASNYMEGTLYVVYEEA